MPGAGRRELDQANTYRSFAPDLRSTVIGGFHDGGGEEKPER